MYLEYYGFTEEPFNITPNSKFLFLSERHREALGSLLYGIEQRKGFIALTGEIGCGKTTICRAMLGKLDRSRVRLALILNPQLSDVELLQTINGEFGIENASASKRELLAALNRFLLEEYQHDRNVVLLIDEAQRLSPDALEQVRLLSNLETETAKLLQIALVGQPELADMLDLSELEQLNQRITVRYHISPLTFEELGDYVSHRLTVAGAKVPVRFDKKALKKVYEFSNGVPRRINVLCDRALLVGYVREETDITEEIVLKAIDEVGGMPKRGKKARAAAKVEAEDAEEFAAPAAASSGGGSAPSRQMWPMALAMLLGLGAIAYAINSLRTEDNSSTPPTVVDAAPQTGLVAKELPSPTATATPTPEPTPAITATPTVTPEPTPNTTPAPTATPDQTATPTPESTPEPTPVAAVTTPTATLEPTMTPEPTPTPTPTPVPINWSYDADGIVRVDDPRTTFPAAVLTWAERTGSGRLEEGELSTLRKMPAEQVAQLQLTTGRAPHFIREARMPANLTLLDAKFLPALIQSDDTSGFGPWSVLTAIEGENAILHDPRGGVMNLSLTKIDEHLTAVVVPFRDPEGLTGLRAPANGDAVFALQRRLRSLGLYIIDPSSGVYDPLTEAGVRRFRENAMLPGPAEVDAATALRLINESGGATR